MYLFTCTEFLRVRVRGDPQRLEKLSRYKDDLIKQKRKQNNRRN